MRVVEIERPAISTGGVLAKVRYMGLCGSDLNIFARRDSMVKLPVIPGHEVDAITEEMRPGVPTELKKDMNVTLNSYTSCGKCAPCRSGRVSTCKHNGTLGVQRNGVMCGYVVLPWSKIIPAGGIIPRDCALIESMSVGSHVVFRGQIIDNEYVMVIGYGITGISAIARAALRGAKVIAVGLDNERPKLAKRVSASYVVNFKIENVHERMLGMAEGFGADVVIETIRGPATYVMAADGVALTGRVVRIGYAKSEVAFQTKYFVQKEIDICGSHNALPTDFRAVINYMRPGSCPIEELVSKIVSPENALNAMEEQAVAPGKVFRILVQL